MRVHSDVHSSESRCKARDRQKVRVLNLVGGVLRIVYLDLISGLRNRLPISIIDEKASWNSTALGAGFSRTRAPDNSFVRSRTVPEIQKIEPYSQ
jgi:hypothetical protein